MMKGREGETHRGIRRQQQLVVEERMKEKDVKDKRSNEEDPRTRRGNSGQFLESGGGRNRTRKERGGERQLVVSSGQGRERSKGRRGILKGKLIGEKERGPKKREGRGSIAHRYFMRGNTSKGKQSTLRKNLNENAIFDGEGKAKSYYGRITKICGFFCVCARARVIHYGVLT